MSEYAQQQRWFARRHQDEDQPPEQADLRNDDLDQDVACCLAEIDKALDREQAERDQAKREFRAFDWYTTDGELNRWVAKYAHLGLKYGRSCCFSLYLVDSKDEEGEK